MTAFLQNKLKITNINKYYTIVKLKYYQNFESPYNY